MEEYEYKTLSEREGEYWWYRHLHDVILQTFNTYKASRESWILDAGCGTGQNIHNLANKVSRNVFGFDISQHAIPFWQKKQLKNLCVSSVNQIPYQKETFDHVVCVDVLESLEVDEADAIRELVRVTCPGGMIYLVVPAFNWLMSPRHHQAVHAVRRYTPGKLIDLLVNLPVQVLRTTYLFTPVFPLVAFFRFIQRIFFYSTQKPPHSELMVLPAWLNWFLFKFTHLELYFLPWFNQPIGSSILAVIQKDL
jgi:ubiquinone/menaquinone biosynthesis C-methylase UbiE